MSANVSPFNICFCSPRVKSARPKLKKRSAPSSIPLIAFVQFIFCSLQLLFLQSRLWSARPLHSTAALFIMSEVGVAIDYLESEMEWQLFWYELLHDFTCTLQSLSRSTDGFLWRADMTTTNRKTLGNSRLRKLMGVFDKHRHTHTHTMVCAGCYCKCHRSATEFLQFKRCKISHTENALNLSDFPAMPTTESAVQDHNWN